MQIKIDDILNTFRSAAGMDKKKILLIGLILCILVYLDASFILKAQLSAIAHLSPRINKLKKDIAGLDKELRSARELKDKGTAAVKKETGQAKRIIREEEIPSLLQDITNIVNKENLKMLQMKPRKDPKAKEEAVAGIGVIPVSVGIQLRGGYHALGNFVNAVENSGKLMLVESIDIMAEEGDYLHHNARIEIKTYVKR